MKSVTFKDGEDTVTVEIVSSGKFIWIDDQNTDILIGVESIDKLIEALNKIKEGLE
jgi:hypothetical protein